MHQSLLRTRACVRSVQRMYAKTKTKKKRKKTNNGSSSSGSWKEEEVPDSEVDERMKGKGGEGVAIYTGRILHSERGRRFGFLEHLVEGRWGVLLTLRCNFHRLRRRRCLLLRMRILNRRRCEERWSRAVELLLATLHLVLSILYSMRSRLPANSNGGGVASFWLRWKTRYHCGGAPSSSAIISRRLLEEICRSTDLPEATNLRRRAIHRQ